MESYTKNFNDGWQFKKIGHEDFIEVTLPHCPRVEPLNTFLPEQGKYLYRKTIFAPDKWRDCRATVRFEGVMMKAKVKLNGDFICEHAGGYLPFVADLTKALRFGQDNELSVEVDNRDDTNVPPGKPTDKVDFLYYGGIYRNVTLSVTPKVFLADAVEEGARGAEPNAGGIFFQTIFADSSSAKAELCVSVRNIGCGEAQASVRYRLSRDGETAASGEETLRVSEGTGKDFRANILVANPALWSPDSPALYRLDLETDSNFGVDKKTIFVGLRHASVTRDGFFLNGEKIELFGVNRHQQYPYIGIAAGDNAERREARLLKESGINAVRLSHYPQNPAFLEECDRLGLILIEPIPGWQFCKRGVFRKRLKENARDMARRDLNHASVLIFEASPNETPFYFGGASDRFFAKLKKIIQAEAPFCLTAGDTAGRRNPAVPNYDIPYTYDNAKKRRKLCGKLTLTREFGDWAFGGNQSTSRCSINDGEAAMRRQAWNFQWNYNDIMEKGGLLGALVWEGIDHNRGYYPKEPVSKSGIMDEFRLPKFSYSLFASQGKPPVLTAAAWSPVGLRRLPVYTNMGAVTLYLNGEKYAEKTPDDGANAPFDEANLKKTNDNYWEKGENHIAVSEVSDLARHTLNCLFDGGNCDNLKHPPVTFDLPELGKDDVLTAEAAAENGKKYVCRVACPKKPYTLTISVADRGIPLKADGSDFAFVYVKIVDAFGMPVYDARDKVALQAENGETIGHTEIEPRGGSAPFMLKSVKHAKSVRLTATCGDLIAQAEIFTEA